MEYIQKTPIEKGWSADRKYRVQLRDGKACLLRVSDLKEYDKKKREFELMEHIAALGVPMCRPVEFGICDEGVYSLLEWIDGEDAEAVIPELSEDEQYRFGVEAGRILRLIHTLPAPAGAGDWESRMNGKFDRKIQSYLDCPLKYKNGDALIDFINENRGLLRARPQVMQHGDYHIGNMMVDNTGRLVIIDFNRFDCGDPWEEFKSIVWCVKCSPAFASGRVYGYFGGAVPDRFWKLLALYISYASISSLPWAIPFGEGEIKTMLDQSEDIMRWYDNMKRYIPDWYGKRHSFYS